VPRVLLIEDDPDVRETVTAALRRDAFDVTSMERGKPALKSLDSGSYDVIVTDLVLPDMYGLDIVRHVRERFPCGIVVISGKGETIDRIVGIEAGADDYLGKPFSMHELCARVRSVVRRSRCAPHPVKEVVSTPSAFLFRGFRYEPDRMSLTHREQGAVRLTTGEAQLLALMLERAGRVISRESIMEHTHGDHPAAYDRAVDIAVSRLRRKLRAADPEGEFIRAVRGIGYSFVETPRRT